MLDGLFGRSNFKNKCKSALTRTKTRLEVIKKKRNAMQRFLKKDIVDLLQNDLERNAYGRAEGLYIELNLSSCYDYVEQCCACMSEHLKEMQKQSECPEECKVAAASLIYAAARFADLPELRNLRDLLNEKYGKALEPYVSKEFVEKLKAHCPTMEMKLQLMQDIAQEFSLMWDPKPLEQQLQNPSITTNDKFPRSRSNIVKETQAESDKRTDEEDSSEGAKLRYSHSCLTFSDNLEEQHAKREAVMPFATSRSDSEDYANTKPFVNRIVPAPYTIASKGDDDNEFGSRYKEKKTDHKLDMEKNNGSDEGSVGRVRPRPRSVRTKFLKQSQSTVVSSSEHDHTDVKETLSARVPGTRGYGLRTYDKDTDDDMEDVFSANYMKKKSLRTPTSARSENSNAQLTSELPLPPGRRRYLFPESQPATPLKEADVNVNIKSEVSSGKSKFLPPDQTQAEQPAEPKHRHSRSSSFQNDHVHPKMPDFDELAERIAAFRNIEG